MLLRICLILAILAGLAVIGVTQFQIRPQMKTIIETRDYNSNQWVMFEGKYKDSQRQLKTTQETLQKTERDLEGTKADLSVARTRANEQQNRADKLKKDLDGTRSELNTAQQQLAAWSITGLTPDQVQAHLDSEKKLREANDALEAEKKVLVKVNRELNDQIEELLNPDRIPPLPAGLVGQVTAVDPKWDFVVLNVGKAQEVKTRGELIVVREGRLISKVKIAEVRNDSCIANILPGWKLEDVMEGDSVVPLVAK